METGEMVRKGNSGQGLSKTSSPIWHMPFASSTLQAN